jgi:hypothetical protein
MSVYEARIIRMALVYLVLTGALGVLFYLAPAVAAYYRTTHIHLGVIGFFLSMVMGVAFWMMPRPGGLRQERHEAVTFWLLNAGLILRFFAEPAWRSTGAAPLHVATVVSGLLVFGAILVFVNAMFARVQTTDTIRRMREEREAAARAGGALTARRSPP